MEQGIQLMTAGAVTGDGILGESTLQTVALALDAMPLVVVMEGTMW